MFLVIDFYLLKAHLSCALNWNIFVNRIILVIRDRSSLCIFVCKVYKQVGESSADRVEGVYCARRRRLVPTGDARELSVRAT